MHTKSVLFPILFTSTGVLHQYEQDVCELRRKRVMNFLQLNRILNSSEAVIWCLVDVISRAKHLHSCLLGNLVFLMQICIGKDFCRWLMCQGFLADMSIKLSLGKQMCCTTFQCMNTHRAATVSFYLSNSTKK